MDKRFFKLDVDTSIGEMMEIVRAKSVESFGVNLGGAVAAEEFVFKENANFGHHGLAFWTARCSNLDAGEEIFLPIGAQLPNGQLTSSDDHRFA